MENRWGVSKGFNNYELFSIVSLLPQKAVTLLLFFLGGALALYKVAWLRWQGAPAPPLDPQRWTGRENFHMARRQSQGFF